ncbi:hypothetical protein ElyMa_006898500 [Elysia marginata]|uniref:Uncharacterized protein n=1 Tax=Elysia marginata TaxID=1093978 RepID=A0AAV4JEP8_9GAST|nr:hypothetical protein ElyMa_006898500 [Elysia marginata]
MLHIQIACGITYYVYSSTRGPSLRPPDSCEAGPAVLTDNCPYPASPSGPVGRSELVHWYIAAGATVGSSWNRHWSHRWSHRWRHPSII